MWFLAMGVGARSIALMKQWWQSSSINHKKGIIIESNLKKLLSERYEYFKIGITFEVRKSSD